MSTRVMLSGHNFSQTELPESISAGEPVFVLDTPETLLVPAALFEPGMELGYMSSSGFYLSAGKTVAVSPILCDTVALMMFPENIIRELNGRFDKCSFRSPLQEMISCGRSINLFLTSDCAYVTVCDGELKFAEVFPDRTTDSILYYLQEIKKELSAGKFPVNLSGENTDAVANELSRYYKINICA